MSYLLPLSLSNLKVKIHALVALSDPLPAFIRDHSHFIPELLQYLVLQFRIRSQPPHVIVEWSIHLNHHIEILNQEIHVVKTTNQHLLLDAQAQRLKLLLSVCLEV